MENVKEQPRALIWERAQRSISTTLEQITLLNYLPVPTSQPTVAIIGAGAAIEVKSLHDYFTTHQRSAPRIIAFDVDKDIRILTEEIARLDGVEVDYRTANAADPSVFLNEAYDLVVARKPDIHNHDYIWRQIIENAFDRLKPGGGMLVTTSEPSAYTFVCIELGKHGDIVLEHNIPQDLRAEPFYNEDRLILARKRAI